MDHNVILSNARIEFMRGFVEAMQRAIPRCIEDCFIKANDSFSSLEQGRLLDARSVLVEQRESVVQQMTSVMDQLLERSFKTTYSTYRPSANFKTDDLTLIDPSTFEGGLRLEEITNQFRRAAEEQLRDLNIRIAIIFEQEITNERENPFRPYLLSRCISLTIENFNVNPNIVEILTDRLSANFVSFVPGIYTSVNQHFEKNGIAAQLQLKIKKSPTQITDQGEENDDEEQIEAQTSSRAGTKGMQDTARTRKQAASPIEQFFNSALNRAANLVGRPKKATPLSENASSHQVSFHENQFLSAADSVPESLNFPWQKNGEAIGETLKRFFGLLSVPKDPQEIVMGHSIANSSVSNEAQSADSRYLGDINEIGREYVESSSSGSIAPQFAVDDYLQSQTGAATESNMDRGGKLPQSIHIFQKMHTPIGSDMFDRNGGIRNLILEQRKALNALTSNIDEQMTIDIVAMLFEFILRDTQVIAEIRAQLGRLQFLVLKLALKDSTLLTQKGHPARLLVNRIGSISLGLKQVDPSGEKITGEICRIVEALLQDETESTQLFSRMLDEFDVFIEKELREGDRKIECAIEGAEHIRNRTIRFVHTASLLREALADLTIDPFLQNFFETVWMYVLERADQEDAKRAYRFRLVVPDLLWSIIPKNYEEERTQLITLLPVILGTLKEGMASINSDSETQERLMNWLVDAHTKAMRINQSATVHRYPTLSSVHNHFNNFYVDADLENYAALKEDESSDVKRFLDEAAKELDAEVQLLDQVYVQALPKDAEGPDEKRIEGTEDPVLEQLKIGVAVEINLGGEPNQGKLNWIDPALTNLILTLEGQEQPSMLSVRMFRRMIAHGRVKFLEREPLFERAVQSLLKSADVMEPSRA